MLYHSEPVTRSIVLWAMKKLYPEDYTLWAEVERGALTEASNRERKEYFGYACGTLGWFILPFIPCSVLSMFLLMSITHSMNVLVGFSLILIFLPNSISGAFLKKQKQCDTSAEPVVFATKDLILTTLKVAFWSFLFAGILSWIMSY